MSKEHAFTPVLLRILADAFGEESAKSVYDSSPLLQYINVKTQSANRGSKARGSFANLYAIYVLVEDYVKGGFADGGDYSVYAGAQFSSLFARQRQLPFGDKLQNHALNSRLNEEFRKYFPLTENVPIIRDLSTTRYWVNQDLLKVQSSDGTTRDIGPSVLSIIDAYVKAKRDSFQQFLETCRQLLSGGESDDVQRVRFVESLLEPNVDARVFEIVSFAILKSHYGNRTVWIGWARDSVREETLSLFKTGRTNANDGGIDFVMRPLGRFYQVTETLDLRKYFLDIDKIQRFPITFVVKTEVDIDQLHQNLRLHAKKTFHVESVVDSYVQAVEEIINLPMLRAYLGAAVAARMVDGILLEMSLQARVEFNLDEDEEAIASGTSATASPDQ
jgi:hypothetical protein